MAAAKKVPAGCSQCERHAARSWPDTIPTGYGDEAMKHPKPMPRVVPRSTLARWFLALRRWLLG